MLTALVVVPLVAAGALAVGRHIPARAAGLAWLIVSFLELGLVAATAALALPQLPQTQNLVVGAVDGLALEQRSASLPGIGVSWHVGVDGLSLPMLGLTGVLFVVCALWSLRERRAPRQQAALYLALEATCAGVFTAQDLIVFFLWFDLAIVGMAFSIAHWGHGQRQRSALVFFLFTFAGSLALLVGFIGLALGSPGHSFDLVDLALRGFGGGPVAAAFVLGAIVLGLAVKTPAVPLHSWLPPAHTDAPTIGSVVLAGLLLKMGTYGFLRIAMPLLPEAWRSFGWVVLILGIVSALWGALVALGQTDFKRMIAFTSVNHMGFVLMGLGAAGVAGGGFAAQVAITGAIVQMVSHGLTTGALFLLAGILRDRRGTAEIDRFGGLAAPAPRFAGLLGVAAFASLGIPAFSGFVAEFQLFTGSIGATWWAAAALPGIVLTAALLLRAVQRMVTGTPSRSAVGFADLAPGETLAIGSLLACSLLIGVLPGLLLEVVAPAAAHLATLLGSS